MIRNKFFAGKKPAQAMVEFAIALPILLLMLYGIIEAGRLLFVYSTVVTASRQAARYGSATGVNDADTPHYQDCAGIRAAASKVAFFGPFEKIDLAYDQGVTNDDPPVRIDPKTYCTGTTDPSLNTEILRGNRTRLVVTVQEQFHPLVKLVPFFDRPIVATSARTILYSVPIVVEQEQQEWYKVPTETIITSDDPDPSQIEEWVTVTVTVSNIGNGDDPTGKVFINGADDNCEITLVNGTGSCPVRFNNAGSMVISAFYEGDDDHLASSDDEPHEVTIWKTETEIISDEPDFSVVREDVTVVVRVKGGRIDPTGTVDVDGGQGTRCTVPSLTNGVGSCILSFGSDGPKQIIASYSGDSLHMPSTSLPQPHMVYRATPTPTPIPTATKIPTSTPIPATPTITLTPTQIPTAVSTCDQIGHGDIQYSGNTMTMTISNPYPFNIVMNDMTVWWNWDKGHRTTNDKSLILQQVSVGGIPVWMGSELAESKIIPTTAVIPPGTTTVTLTFHQSYDNTDTSERVYINLLTPGCEANPIDSKK